MQALSAGVPLRDMERVRPFSIKIDFILAELFKNFIF